MSAPTLVPAIYRIGIFSSSRTLRTPTWAIPRAKPPPRATPRPTSGAAASSGRRENSRPKACTERMIAPDVGVTVKSLGKIIRSVQGFGREFSRRPEEAAAPEVGLGVALGGGFARGIAHVGVLKVLEEENIPIR